MPCALADAWFEEKLNSVSISFWRQKMGKTKDDKKKPTQTQEVKGSPATRSKGGASMKSSDSGTSERRRDGTASKRRKVKPDDQTKMKTESATPKEKPTKDATSPVIKPDGSIDISALLYVVERRVRKKHNFEEIAAAMPLQHKAWTLMNMRKFARTLNLKFTDDHYLA